MDCSIRALQKERRGLPTRSGRKCHETSVGNEFVEMNGWDVPLRNEREAYVMDMETDSQRNESDFANATSLRELEALREESFQARSTTIVMDMNSAYPAPNG